LDEQVQSENYIEEQENMEKAFENLEKCERMI
jgi:hypothetical protein